MGVEIEKFEEKNLKTDYWLYKYKKKWLSGLRRQTVNLLGIPIISSNLIFFIFKSLRFNEI